MVLDVGDLGICDFEVESVGEGTMVIRLGRVVGEGYGWFWS